MTNSKDVHWNALFGGLLSSLDPVPEPQDYPGLDAAGFLLVALGHLAKAKENLDQEPPSASAYRAKWETTLAANHVRYALKVLDEQKEKTCKESSGS